MASLRWSHLAPALLVVAGLTPNCASLAEDSAPTQRCYGPNCVDAGEGGRAAYAAVALSPDAGTEDARASADPACGTGCNPDQGARACAASELGDSSGTGWVDAGSEAGNGDTVGCFVSLRAGASVVTAECMAAGEGLDGDPCGSARDCAPGFACVGQNAGQCRPYCCYGSDVCAAGRFCDQQPLFEPGVIASLVRQTVPVCIAGSDCSLGDPINCVASNSGTCRCPLGTVCTVVRCDLTTACKTPGTSVAGERCPCAPGYVCSEGSQTCLKLCSTKALVSECPAGTCQSSACLPDGFGVCTGGVIADGG